MKRSPAGEAGPDAAELLKFLILLEDLLQESSIRNTNLPKAGEAKVHEFMNQYVAM